MRALLFSAALLGCSCPDVGETEPPVRAAWSNLRLAEHFIQNIQGARATGTLTPDAASKHLKNWLEMQQEAQERLDKALLEHYRARICHGE